MGILKQPTYWKDADGNTPPFNWEALLADERWYFFHGMMSNSSVFPVIYRRASFVENYSTLATTDGSGNASFNIGSMNVVSGSISLRVTSPDFDTEWFHDDVTPGQLYGEYSGTGTINYATGDVVLTNALADGDVNYTLYAFIDAAFPPLPATLTFQYQVITPGTDNARLQYYLNDDQHEVYLINEVGTHTVEIAINDQDAYFSWTISTDNPSGNFYSGDFAVGEPALDYDIALTWTDGTAGSNPIADYRLYRSIDATAYTLLATIPAADPQEYLEVLPTPESTYAYYVTARDTEGHESVPSNIYSVVVPAGSTPLPIPPRLTADLVNYAGMVPYYGFNTIHGATDPYDYYGWGAISTDLVVPGYTIIALVYAPDTDQGMYFALAGDTLPPDDAFVSLSWVDDADITRTLNAVDANILTIEAGDGAGVTKVWRWRNDYANWPFSVGDGFNTQRIYLITIV